MKDKLINVLKKCETKQLANIFKNYMESKGVKKLDRRLIDGENTSWNRVECYYNNGSEEYGEEDLLIVLRKRSGYYLIVARKGERAFEYDYELRHYDEDLLNEIYSEHKELFDSLFSIK